MKKYLFIVFDESYGTLCPMGVSKITNCLTTGKKREKLADEYNFICKTLGLKRSTSPY